MSKEEFYIIYLIASISSILFFLVYLIRRYRRVFGSLKTNGTFMTEDNNKKFKNTILSMLDKESLDKIDIDFINIISQSCNIDSIDTAINLKEIIRDLIDDKSSKKSKDKGTPNLSKKIDLLKKIISDIEKEKPFYNLPKDISNICNDIYDDLILSKKNTKAIDKLSSLASIIRTMQDTTNRLVNKNKLLGWVALAIGIAGIAATITTYLLMQK